MGSSCRGQALQGRTNLRQLTGGDCASSLPGPFAGPCRLAQPWDVAFPPPTLGTPCPFALFVHVFDQSWFFARLWVPV
eukprot:3846078-Amphidinium_carterae.1